MLEGHVLRELLAPGLKSAKLFSFHEIFHGVTAPGFLFGAGFTFAIATQRRWEQSIAFTPGFFRRSWRALLLILIGYALHFPFLSLQKTLSSADPVQWNVFFTFDVLQCIGICLLIMRFSLALMKQERLFIFTLTALLFIIVYSAPFLWAERSMPLIISSAINGLTGSPFPLFPFAGFLIAGTCVSWLFLRASQYRREDVFIKRLMVSGLLLISISGLLEIVPLQIYPGSNYWSTGPNYFWLRLGFLFLMLSSLWYIEDFFASHGSSIAVMPKWLIFLGIESLFVYIAHLLILCGWVTNTSLNLRWWWGGKLNVTESFLVFAGLTLLMIPSSFAWRHLKKNHPVLMKGVFWWMGFCVAWSFFFNPY
jgi:acyltransferase